MVVNEISSKLDLISKNIEIDLNEILELAIYEAITILKLRIFEENKTIDNSSFGKYTNLSYEKKRKKAVKPTGVINLQYEKNLLRSIKTNISNEGYQILISGVENKLKAQGFEENKYKVNFANTKERKVFVMSDEEIKKIIKYVNREWSRNIRESN